MTTLSSATDLTSDKSLSGKDATMATTDSAIYVTSTHALNDASMIMMITITQTFTAQKSQLNTKHRHKGLNLNLNDVDLRAPKS